MNDSAIILGDSKTRLAIIEVLDKHKSLSAKNIHTKLKKEAGITITYQATHKCLKKMSEKDFEIVEELTRQIMTKTLHNPIMALKKISGTNNRRDRGISIRDRKKIIEELFGYKKQ